MVFSHRRALRARLLLIRLLMGHIQNCFSPRRLVIEIDKVMAGETPANPAAPATTRDAFDSCYGTVVSVKVILVGPPLFVTVKEPVNLELLLRVKSAENLVPKSPDSLARVQSFLSRALL
jgi:hypothetical protein